MQLTDLGFLFLLLPTSVAAYYCVPNRRKPLALLLISIFFLLLIDRRSWLLLCASVALDCIALHNGKLSRGKPRLIDLCIAKHVAAIGLCCVLLPLSGIGLPMVGMAVFSLSAIELLLAIRRGRECPSCVDYAATVLLIGRIPFGPIGASEQVLLALHTPTPSLSGIGRGVMLIISGVTKQAVLSGEFIALFRTLSHIGSNQMAVATGWFYALCCALGLYFVLSGYSDIAQGLGLIFSIPLPRTVYYPLQAPSLREYLYRFNMPLEDSVYRLLLPNIKREEKKPQLFLISAMMPLLLGLFVGSVELFLPWGIVMGCFVLLDWLLLHRLPIISSLFARCVTLLLTLPTYLLLLPVELEQRLTLFGTAFGLGDVVLFNQATFYLLQSNLALLLVGILFCSNLFDQLGRLTERQFPRLWWIFSATGHLVLLMVATSFLLWNVR